MTVNELLSLMVILISGDEVTVLFLEMEMEIQKQKNKTLC